MSKISLDLIKELRERSGVGMSKCKEALVEAEGDVKKAIEILRKAGLTSSVKKEGRETKEGCIGFFETDTHIAMLEINTETDFVAKNEKFKKFVKELSEQVAKNEIVSVDEFLKANYEIDPSLTVDEYRNLLIQSIGENIQINRLEVIHKDSDSSYGIYSHMGGKIVSIVEIKGSNDVKTIAYDIAMHIAAEDPIYLKPDDVPATVLKKEEEIAHSQIKNKPDFVKDKIVKGKIKAYYDGTCLLNQKFIKDPSINVSQFVEAKAKELAKPLSVSCFWRWKIGESA